LWHGRGCPRGENLAPVGGTPPHSLAGAVGPPAPSINPSATPIGAQAILFIGSTTGVQKPAGITARVGGLTIGTAYWFDENLKSSNAADSCALASVSESAQEQ
jgi:hypothetical protein